MRSSTPLTAALAVASWALPAAVSCVGKARPDAGCSDLVTSPSASSACSSTFIACLVTKVPRASSEFDRPGRWASSSRQE